MLPLPTNLNASVVDNLVTLPVLRLLGLVCRFLEWVCRLLGRVRNSSRSPLVRNSSRSPLVGNSSRSPLVRNTSLCPLVCRRPFDTGAGLPQGVSRYHYLGTLGVGTVATGSEDVDHTYNCVVQDKAEQRPR